MQSEFSDELELALKAVHRASIVTKNVMKGIESLDKSDASPVTMADFAAQALMVCAIHNTFPDDGFIAEESADMLREDQTLRERVWRLVKSANASCRGFSNTLKTPEDETEMMKMIDLGSSDDTPTSGRVWIMDPIDGTATFLKGQQYAVCLSLTVDGRQKIGVLGCPNLKPEAGRVEENLTDNDGFGILLGAVHGHGAFLAAISREGLGERKPVKRGSDPIDTRDLQFTDSGKSSHADLPSHEKVFKRLNLCKPYIDLWCMQIKYIALALGACDATIRLRRDPTMKACVWDHAGGQLIFTEAGGKVVDMDKKEFDFAQGRQFADNWGFVAADRNAFDAVFAVAQEVLRERRSVRTGN